MRDLYEKFQHQLNEPTSDLRQRPGDFAFAGALKPQPGGLPFEEYPLFSCRGELVVSEADCPGAEKRIPVGWVFLISGLLAACCGFFLYGQWMQEQQAEKAGPAGLQHIEMDRFVGVEGGAPGDNKNNRLL